MKKSWWIGKYEVTIRELLASITIIAVMMILGFVFAGKIEEHQMDKNAEYYKSAKITETEMFRYGMDTSIGNALVYGDLEAVDTVTFPEIGGEYLYVKKVEEHYNMHTRTVTYTDSDGKPIQGQKHIGHGIMPEVKKSIVRKSNFAISKWIILKWLCRERIT